MDGGCGLELGVEALSEVILMDSKWREGTLGMGLGADSCSMLRFSLWVLLECEFWGGFHVWS